MERDRPIAKWIRSAYIVYGIIFLTILGGVVQVLDVSDHINYALVSFLEINSEGPKLDGNYLFPKNWLTLFILFTLLMLVFPATTLFRSYFEHDDFKKTEDLSSVETIGLKQDLDDAMRYANNITAYIYPSAEYSRPRFNLLESLTTYKVDANGDTEAEAISELYCINDPFHFYIHWIRSDPESGDVKFLRQLNFQAFDLDNDQKLDWLPIQNDATRKAFAIFFPEVQRGQHKRLKVVYRWPKFMGKLIELGATNFDWRYVTGDTPANLRNEWVFHSNLSPVECRTIGRHPPSANIRFEQRGTHFAWIYEDPKAQLNSEYAVEFFKPT